MVTLSKPDNPATSRQLYRLHELTGEDTREWELTMQEASERITALENQNKEIQTPVITTGTKPFSEAHVTLIEGDQGSGKSVTATGMVVDSYYKDCVRVFCKEKLNIDVEVKSYDRLNRVGKIFHQGKNKIVHIPEYYKLHSPMRIFANFHIYGIPYVFCPTFRHILQWLKQGLIVNGWLIMDEAYIGTNARDSMTAFGKEMEKQGFQMRKMQLEVVYISPLSGLLDKFTRLTPTKRILCSYNKQICEVTLEIRQKGVKGVKTVPYDASQYFVNYWTNERINK